MLTCQRELFCLPEDVHYLNCAYMSPLLRTTEDAGIAGIRRKCAPQKIRPADFFEDSDRLRALFARLINAPDPARVAIIPAVSYGIATAARNLRPERGQNIVLPGEQFPSNVYSWRRLADERGFEIRTVEPPHQSVGRGREWNARLLDAINRNTALVALGHVHWADGTRFDLRAIGERAREVGAALIVDGTQSVGALPFDVAEIQPDVLVCAGYKWLLGPYGLGVAYFGPCFDGGTPLEENWITRAGSEEFGGLVRYRDEYQPGAVRYDVGERSSFVLAPMLIAALEQIGEWGAAEIQTYCRVLTGDLLREARELGYAVEEEEWRGGHLFGIRTPAGLDAPALESALRERRIAVSIRGSAVRVSPHLYNDERDITALRDALRAAVQ